MVLGGLESLEHACDLLAAACLPRGRAALPSVVRLPLERLGLCHTVAPVEIEASGIGAVSGSAAATSSAMIPSDGKASGRSRATVADRLKAVPTPPGGVQIVLAACRAVNAVLGRYAHDGVSLTSDTMESVLHLTMELARMEGTRPAFAIPLPSAPMGGSDNPSKLPAAVTLWNLATFSDVPNGEPMPTEAV